MTDISQKKQDHYQLKGFFILINFRKVHSLFEKLSQVSSSQTHLISYKILSGVNQDSNKCLQSLL